MVRSISTFFAIGLFLACSSTKDGGDHEENPLAGVEGFCAEWAKRACNETVVARCSATDQDACIAAQAGFCVDHVPAGKYSAATAEECLEAVAKAYEDAELTAEERDTVLKVEADCLRVISGSAGPDEDCTETADCNTDANLVCILKADGAGSCQDAVVVEGGFECSSPDTLCAEGFFCDGTNCLSNKGDGASCDASVPCAAEFKCEGPDGQPPGEGGDAGAATCIAKLGVGEDCVKDLDCLSDICIEVCADKIQLSTSDPVCADLR